MAVTLHQLLKTMVERGGSDLHVTTNSPPQIRIDGKLVPLDMPPLTAPETKQLAYSRPHRRAEAPLRGEPRARPLLRHQGPGPLPRQHLQPARRHGRRLPADPLRDPRLQGARSPAGRRGDLQQAARPGARHRPHRLRQVDDARGDDRQDQPRAPRAHHHHRGPGRVPALSTRTASSTSASCTPTRTPSRQRAASPPCGRTPTSCSSARCATSRPSSPRCASPRRAT